METISTTTSNQDLVKLLKDFTSEYVNPMNRVSWESQKQQNVLKTLITLLKEPEREECALFILQSIKVFTRNSTLLESIVDLEFLDDLLTKAGLKVDCTTRKDLTEPKIEVIVEAQRCLSNIYFQCCRAQDFALENDTLPAILQQTTKYNEYQIPASIISFDMRLLFLVTARRPEARTLVVVEHRAISRLADILNVLLNRAKRSGNGSQKACFPEEELTATLDVLKALFNTLCILEKREVDEEESSLLIKLCQILQTFMLIEISTGERKFDLVGNCVHVLTNYKGQWMDPLMEPFDKEFIGGNVKEIEYDGKNMNSPQILLDYLDHSLNQIGGNKAHESLRDNLSPILKVLVTISTSHPKIRKYFRSQILPPLRDVTNRPEVGSTLRNKLCRLLTSPDVTVAVMVAEFLFILCKEKVDRFVKHTGYGNAAGLLARRGMLMGSQRVGNDPVYSDEDSDSDTEEYISNVHKINPVTGHVQPTPKKSPFEGMTEEQKEYEANQLANLINKLHELGAVKPAKIGPDGKPVPVEHVLEFRDSVIQNEQNNESAEESD